MHIENILKGREMKFLYMLLACMIFVSQIHSMDVASGDSGIDSPYVKNYFLIALSTKSYKEAKGFADKLSDQSGIELNLRGLQAHSKISLSYSQEQCVSGWGEYPCYIARGRYDDGMYISIEHSDAYGGFRGGYYIVVVASGEKSVAKKALKIIKPIVSDAYIKSSKVYMGCMH